MDFDGSGFLAGLIGSGVGFIFFSYGKKMNRPPQLGIGLCLLIAPYFLPSAAWIAVVSLGLLGLLGLLLRRGY